MKLKACVPALAALLAATHLASPAAAQLGGLRSLVPGAGTSSAAATDPDSFLAETIETTKMMMVAAALLAAASSQDENRDALRAEISAIQGSSSIDELNTHTDSFRENTRVLEKNADDATTLQARYDAASKEQQELMLNAAFNFSLAMMRNVRLGQPLWFAGILDGAQTTAARAVTSSTISTDASSGCLSDYHDHEALTLQSDELDR